HHVRDCTYLGKRPPADNPSGSATPKRSKSGAGGKSAKAAKKKVCDANESDDSAYVVLSLMNLEKKVAAFAHDRWYLDTGATSHITNQKVDFVSFTSLSSTVRVGGKNWLEVFGVGTVKKVLTTTGRYFLLLRGARYVPELQCSLFTVARQVLRTLCSEGRIRCHFAEEDYADVILYSGRTTARAETNLYRFDLRSPSDMVVLAAFDVEQSVALWHDRLGHPGRNVFNALFRNAR
ncbi:hypothetical protein PHMEG_00038872, partial [Phytophthora megakarya]